MPGNSSPVILVDDSRIEKHLARRSFERSGSDRVLLCFVSGEELLEHLDKVRTGDEPMPGVILLDMNMPGLDGFAILEAIKNDAHFAGRLSVIVLTNAARVDDRDRAIGLGAAGFEIKPATIGEYTEFFAVLEAKQPGFTAF